MFCHLVCFDLYGLVFFLNLRFNHLNLLHIVVRVRRRILPPVFMVWPFLLYHIEHSFSSGFLLQFWWNKLSGEAKVGPCHST